jgi:hypothetical protein
MEEVRRTSPPPPLTPYPGHTLATTPLLPPTPTPTVVQTSASPLLLHPPHPAARKREATHAQGWVKVKEMGMEGAVCSCRSHTEGVGRYLFDFRMMYFPT